MGRASNGKLGLGLVGREQVMRPEKVMFVAGKQPHVLAAAAGARRSLSPATARFSDVARPHSAPCLTFPVMETSASLFSWTC